MGAAGFQPYDTFKCKDGWVFIGAFAGAIYPRVPKFLGLDSKEYVGIWSQVLYFNIVSWSGFDHLIFPGVKK